MQHTSDILAVDALAERLGLSARLLVLSAGAGFESVEVQISDQPWGLPNWSMAELLDRGPDATITASRGISAKAVHAGWHRLASAGSNVHNGTGLRISDTSPSAGITERLKITLQPTNYASTLLTHDPATPAYRPDELDRRRANLMGCSIWLMCADGQVIATRRKDNVSWNPGRLASSSSGGMDVADLDNADPITASAARELSEELGVSSNEAVITFGGLVIGPDHMLDLVGVARTPLSSEQVLDRNTSDAHEVSELLPLSTEHSSIGAWLGSLLNDDWDPVSGLGILLLLTELHGDAALRKGLEAAQA